MQFVPFRRVATLTLVLSVFLVGPVVAALPVRFLRGDVDSSGAVNVTDAVRIFLHLFGGEGSPPLQCLDAADADDSGDITLTDGIRILTALFSHGRELPQPRDGCGPDSTQDALGCEDYSGCPGVRRNLLDDAESIVFVIERSGTMQDEGELQIAKREVIDAIGAFPESGELGVIFNDKQTMGLPVTGAPTPATAASKADLVAFVQRMPGGFGSCLKASLMAAFDSLSFSDREHQVIIYLGDGSGTCPGGDNEAAYLQQTLKAVKTLNVNGVVVHAVETGQQPAGTVQQKFLRDLAAQNGGRFLQINR